MTKATQPLSQIPRSFQALKLALADLNFQVAALEATIPNANPMALDRLYRQRRELFRAIESASYGMAA